MSRDEGFFSSFFEKFNCFNAVVQSAYSSSPFLMRFSHCCLRHIFLGKCAWLLFYSIDGRWKLIRDALKIGKFVSWNRIEWKEWLTIFLAWYLKNELLWKGKRLSLFIVEWDKYGIMIVQVLMVLWLFPFLAWIYYAISHYLLTEFLCDNNKLFHKLPGPIEHWKLLHSHYYS